MWLFITNQQREHTVQNILCKKNQLGPSSLLCIAEIDCVFIETCGVCANVQREKTTKYKISKALLQLFRTVIIMSLLFA